MSILSKISLELKIEKPKKAEKFQFKNKIRDQDKMGIS